MFGIPASAQRFENVSTTHVFFFCFFFFAFSYLSCLDPWLTSVEDNISLSLYTIHIINVLIGMRTTLISLLSMRILNGAQEFLVEDKNNEQISIEQTGRCRSEL